MMTMTIMMTTMKNSVNSFKCVVVMVVVVVVVMVISSSVTPQ